MKTRITNLLTATIWLLITTVWLPTFWTLAQLPWTWNETNASALLKYVEYDIETIDYTISDADCEKKYGKEERYNWLFCEPELTTETGFSFIPLVVFTLICLAGQYLLMGKVTLRFVRGKNDEEP
mgnify:CR=1 FL=1